MDILRENIGLLQFPQDEYYNEDEDNINEGFLGFGKKKSRWQRFKDAIGRNKSKIAAGAGLLGAGALGGLIGKDYINYRSMVKGLEKEGYKKQKDGSYFMTILPDKDSTEPDITFHDRAITHFRLTNPLKPTPDNDRYISGNTYFTYKGKRFDDWNELRKAQEKDRNGNS